MSVANYVYLTIMFASVVLVLLLFHAGHLGQCKVPDGARSILDLAGTWTVTNRNGSKSHSEDDSYNLRM